jgi:hypothetical protein
MKHLIVYNYFNLLTKYLKVLLVVNLSHLYTI